GTRRCIVGTRREEAAVTAPAVSATLESLCRSVLSRADGGPPDGTLLERFTAGRDEGAFAELVRRHGPMVLGVCRRILRNEADAEDAFQATFLTLVRKAHSVRPPGMVGNWLYGVARTTALKARALARRRRATEREAGERTAARAGDYRDLLTV